MLARLEAAAAYGASFDSELQEESSRCLQNTRVDLLKRILSWSQDTNTEAVFWLNGMAGTGKSTLSRTVAEELASQGRLGASFFFKRGESDRDGMSKFPATIAADIANRQPEFARLVRAAMDDDPSILRKSWQEQFHKLVWSSLAAMPADSWKEIPIIIVIDALDECEREEDIRRIIHLFSRAKSLNGTIMKVFLTSRPDLPPRLGFKAIEGNYEDMILHEVPQEIIGKDIYAFLEHELMRVRSDYNSSVSPDRQLAQDWPGESRLQTLVEMAIPLFIFAATACLFIGDRNCGDPNDLLDEVVMHKTISDDSKLAATYLPVLKAQISGKSAIMKTRIVKEFRDIVGPIVILNSPLSSYALAQVLDIPKTTIDNRLDLLHSVLNVPSSADRPIRLLHLSFRDFLTDLTKKEQNEFWINEREVHAAMLSHCLRIMNRHLCQDICQLRAPGTERSTVDQENMDSCIPQELQYACRSWAYHLNGSAITCGEDNDQVYGFLRHHLLHWLEAMALMGRLFQAAPLLRGVQFFYEVCIHSELR